MLRADNEIYVAVVAITCLMLLLSGVVGIAIVRYQNKVRDMYKLAQTYERTLLQAQLETQNQTLEYIGQELHDNLGQMLSVAMLQLNGLEDELTGSSQQSTVRRMVGTIEGAIQAVRQLAKTLDSGTIQRFGLPDSLTLELERIRQTGRYQTHLHVTGQPYALDDKAGIILFRMAQESLNNALKYARAQTIAITADYQPDLFTLTIADDGQGFVVDEVLSRGIDGAGSGLGNLQQRARLLGGSCTIESQLGNGTCVRIRVPRTTTV